MKITLLLSILTIVFASGCAVNPQLPVSYQSESLTAEDSVVVLMDSLPAPTMTYPGAGCLLCLAAASAGNQDLTKHAKTLSTDDIQSFVKEAEMALKNAGIAVQEIESNQIVIKDLPKFSSKELNTAKKNFGKLKDTYSASKYLVIDINYAGIQRTYSSYVATSEPHAVVAGALYLVDSATNKYDWYVPLSIKRFADGPWKEKPDFPNMTNAYYQAIEDARQKLISPWGGAATPEVSEAK